MNEKDFDALIARLEAGTMTADDRAMLKHFACALRWMGAELKDRTATMARLRRLFGIQTETAARLGIKTNLPDKPVREDPSGSDDSTKSNASSGDGGPTKKDTDHAGKKPKGHGRRGADDYAGAEVERHEHPSLSKGDTCPDCEQARVYELSPGSVLRLYGQGPVKAVIHQPERLRCGSCGTVFTAPLPDSVPDELADASAKAVVSVLHYGCGMPFYRLEKLQTSLGVPLADATQWDFVDSTARVALKVWGALKRLAAKAPKLYVDDTTSRVVELKKKTLAGLESQAGPPAAGVEDDEFDVGPDRVGVYTTGIVAVDDEREIHLYFTGRRHAGENLRDLLEKRPTELGAPMQVCDALSRNIPKNFATVLVKCLTHARRGFVDCLSAFPAEAGHVVSELALIYHHDGIAAEWNLNPKERLAFHRDKSGPVMARLWLWMDDALTSGRVEENSGLGKAIGYFRRHWKELTAFLEIEGAPLSTDLVERSLKWAIQYRKNSQKYRTVNGALVGDILMSVIRTAIVAAQNPVAYLTALLRHKAAVSLRPENWLPWNYQATLATM